MFGELDRDDDTIFTIGEPLLLILFDVTADDDVDDDVDDDGY